ncbi:MAG: hypothetical protein ACR2KW_05810 [Rubrobacter sp.]
MTEKQGPNASGNSNVPLLIMMGSIPLIVLVAVVAAILLSRAGFGLILALGLPFGVSMLGIILLGVWLARVASLARRGGDSGGAERNEGDGARRKKRG